MCKQVFVGRDLKPTAVNTVLHVLQNEDDCGQIHFLEHSYDA
jgi:hypothetical protein